MSVIVNTIQTTNLSYCFSKNEMILDKINLEVPEGSIYGFLGPNGAGKTTTLKLILGLLKNQEGTVSIFNKNFEQNRIEILKKIGSLIEAPSIYAHLTAKENLLIWQKLYQCSKSRIDEVLTIVGLEKTGKKKAGQFSLGMKQRLSIAIALLHEPTLLILDEPTNGLDPNGILEIRELLIKLNQEQKITIVISSHILAEIEKMVTHLSIINKGKILFQGTLDDLHKKQNENAQYLIETNDNKKAREILDKTDYKTLDKNENILVENIDKDAIAKLNTMFVLNNIEVYQLTPVRENLESIFMDLTKN
jgi:ABC-type multidrug transport system ATPase subunit